MHHGRRRGCWSAVCFHIFRSLRRRAEVEDEGVRSLRRRRGEDTEEEGRKEGGGADSRPDFNTKPPRSGAARWRTSILTYCTTRNLLTYMAHPWRAESPALLAICMRLPLPASPSFTAKPRRRRRHIMTRHNDFYPPGKSRSNGGHAAQCAGGTDADALVYYAAGRQRCVQTQSSAADHTGVLLRRCRCVCI